MKLNSFGYMRQVVVVFFVLLCGMAHGQCVNSLTPSCGVYDSCFAPACNCTGSDAKFEYFLNYGKKYCEIFLGLEKLSGQGKVWRDGTLRCLQETIVPQLDGCNCQKMQTTAFDSHVACYTQNGNSICDLPTGDWVDILNATDPLTALTDQKSRKQMLEVAKICLQSAADDTKAVIRQVIEKFK